MNVVQQPYTWQYEQDYLKNDFQNALRRNLHTWARWRTKLNDNLVESVITGSQLNSVEPFRQCLNRDSLDPAHPTTNPKTLLTFSASANSSSNLHKKDFYKYGIPRAKIDPRVQQLATTEGSSVSCPHGSSSGDVLGRHVRARPVAGNDHKEDEELVMDYFNYDTVDSSPSASCVPRRLHRSEATLPVAPTALDAQHDRRTLKSKKCDDRRRLNPPSYVEPFVRSTRIITARKDHHHLCTRSAWHLDEL